jgi:hypothetical protein
MLKISSISDMKSRTEGGDAVHQHIQTKRRTMATRQITYADTMQLTMGCQKVVQSIGQCRGLGGLVGPVRPRWTCKLGPSLTHAVYMTSGKPDVNENYNIKIAHTRVKNHCKAKRKRNETTLLNCRIYQHAFIFVPTPYTASSGALPKYSWNFIIEKC